MKVRFVQPDGNERIIEAEPGISLMEAAVFNMVDGIIGMCGGICSCATCHCHVDAGWLDRLPPPQDGEAEMLEALDDADRYSRLGCQIVLAEALDGISVRIPSTQG